VAGRNRREIEGEGSKMIMKRRAHRQSGLQAKPRAGKGSKRRSKSKRKQRILIAGVSATAPAPTRDDVKPQVIDILNNVANPNSLPITDEKEDLTTDLDIDDDGKKNLAPSYTRVSKSYGGLTVSRQDSGTCKTVGNAIDLVYKRSIGNSK
jgi:hypothetical protein